MTRHRMVLLLLAAAVALLSPSASAAPREPDAAPLPSKAEFGGDGTRVEVLCLSSNELEPLPGTTLRLCPAGLEGASDDVLQKECEVGVADDEGRARFQGLETSDYVLRTDLEGFAATTLGPLGYGDSNPRGPRRLVVLMNPVCWDCG